MKKLLFLIVGILCLCTACKKETFFIYPEVPLAVVSAAPIFTVVVEKVSCFHGGTNLSVVMPNLESYEYRWEINGQVKSHTFQTQGCDCIKQAAVWVTRISDGATVCKELELNSSCLTAN